MFQRISKNKIRKNEQIKISFVIYDVDNRKDVIMSEEIKEEVNVQKQEKCKCTGKCIKVFLLGILASFLGCLIALCLFSAIKRPPMPPKVMRFGPPPVQQIHHSKFRHGQFNGQRPQMGPDFKKREIQKDGNNAPVFKEMRLIIDED